MIERVAPERRKQQVIYLVQTTRAMSGMTRPEFGEYLGVSSEVVRFWEEGRTVPRADRFMDVIDLRRAVIRSQKASKARRGVLARKNHTIAA